MDAFILATKELAEQLLPTCGLIVLILIIVVLLNLNKVLKGVRETLNKTHGTIDLVDTSLNKIQDPLNTVSKVSHGIDHGYDASVKALSDAKDYVVRNKDVLKDKADVVVNKVKNLKKETEVKEPSPEDIIGG